MQIPADPSGHPLLLDREGHVELLMGNEAIVRGAIEAGVGFACGYPGTPSTEVTDGFARLAPALGIPFEYSVNEKIALEVAFSASLAGARSLVAMKHLGLMYAGDPLSTIPYIGTVAGMVIVSAGDPSCLTSPNEQDQRQLTSGFHLPMLDPRTPQEALEATRFAFQLSEVCHLPVILRPTTRVCHTSAPVRFGSILPRRETGFVRDPQHLLPVPMNARRLRVEIEERLEIARELVSDSGLFEKSGGGRRGIFAMGAPAALTADLLRECGVEDELTLVSLGVCYPLPEDWLVERMRELDLALVVEELSPYFEDRLRALSARFKVPIEILGKRTGHLPREHEYLPRVLRPALREALGLELPSAVLPDDEPPAPRPPILCPSCPHRSAFFAARSVFGDEALYFNDIGCYTLGAAPPLLAGDALLSMGSGFSMAAGVARVTGRRTLGFLGDSTFFHSGMPALLNAIKEEADMVAVVMDNEVTAMTGFQPSLTGAVARARLSSVVDIEGVVRALGATDVVTVDPNDLAATIGAFQRAKQAQGLSVIITKRTCPVAQSRAAGGAEIPAGAEELETYAIDHGRCQSCGRELAGQRCEQGVEIGFERSMARARSLEEGQEQERSTVAPCAVRCPLHLCIQGYAAHIASGNYAGALELIEERLPLIDSVCRVCHRPCEEVCVRARLDGPVAINDLKRFVAEWAAEREPRSTGPPGEPQHGLRAAVVGAGPAGLAAAHDLARRGYGVDLYDAADEPGGLLLAGIPSYRLPREVLRRDTRRILDLGVAFHGGRRLGADLELEALLASSDAVLLAVGASRGLELKLDGQGPEVLGALEYLRQQPTGDGGVAVIGGGNSAVDAARTALRRGAARVTLVCLESREEMPAIASEIVEAEHEGVELLTRHRAVALGAGGVELARVEPRVPGELSPENFEPVAGGETRLEVERLIVAIGQVPEAGDLVAADGALTRSGPLLAVDEETGRTSHPRIFAAGDLVPGERTVTDAIAAGLRAAWGLDRLLRGAEAADRRLPPPRVPAGPVAGREGVRRADVDARHVAPELPAEERRRSFEEVVGTLSEADARAEAARCMICGTCGNCRACLDLFGCPAFYLDDGRIEIDPVLCVACGVCAQFCPNGAIYPVPVGEPAEATP